jgi:hypothetical protein
MARTTTSGKLLTKAPAAKASKNSKGSKASPPKGVDPVFAARWNALDKDDRRQIRRLVRIGRPQATAAEAELANGFAAYQRTRPWYRFYFLWIIPIFVAAFIAASNLHPIVIGLVLGATAVSFMSRRNFTRAEKVNAEVLSGEGAAAPASA